MSRLPRMSGRRTALPLIAGLIGVVHAASGAADVPVTPPLGSGASVALEPVPPTALPRRERAVFVCHEGGVPVFADRPCGSAVEARALLVETPRAGAPATTLPRPPAAATRPRRDDGHAERDQPASVASDRCVAMQRQLDELNDRMRAGYSAREAARLWQRWRDAKSLLRAARC